MKAETLDVERLAHALQTVDHLIVDGVDADAARSRIEYAAAVAREYAALADPDAAAEAEFLRPIGGGL